MEQAKLRAWWAARQGLDGSLSGRSPRQVLEAAGWMRSLGGGAPYIGMFARCGAGRAAVDQAVEQLAIHELPSARGCTYVVPAGDFALALQAGQRFGYEPEMKVARKLGVSDAEIEKLCQAVVAALAAAALAPDELRAAVGGAARSLGEEGKKKGLSTTLPLALGALQAAGEIRRISTNGRLDNQRYRYALWRPNPLGAAASPAALSSAGDEWLYGLAERYWSWIGPARLADFRTFAGATVKAAAAAVEALRLQPLPGAAAAGDERLALPRQAAEIADFAPAEAPSYSLVSSLDSLLLLAGVAALVAPEDLDQPVPTAKGSVAAGSLSEVPAHAIFDRGRLIGLWDYDPQAGQVVWFCFAGAVAGGAAAAALRRQVGATEAMIRQQLEDLRSFSLDSPASRQPRLARLREAQAACKVASAAW